MSKRAKVTPPSGNQMRLINLSLPQFQLAQQLDKFCNLARNVEQVVGLNNEYVGFEAAGSLSQSHLI